MIQQTKTKPQETLVLKMNKQMQTFSFDPPFNLVEEGIGLLAVSSFECTISVYKINNQNNSFSVIVSGHWETESAEKTIDELNELLELRSKMVLNYMLNNLEKKVMFKKRLLFV